MAMEIERRFLLRNIPELNQLLTWQLLRQGYLAIDDANEVRIRDQAGVRTLTTKNGNGLSREEVEIPLSDETFAQLWPLTAGRQLEKRRASIPWQGAMLFVDEYLSPVPFLLAEVEFSSEEDANAFAIPEFFGPEVTRIATMRTFKELLAAVKAWKAEAR